MLRENNGTEIRGFVSVAKHLTRNSNHVELLGSLAACVLLFIAIVRLVPVLAGTCAVLRFVKQIRHSGQVARTLIKS